MAIVKAWNIEKANAFIDRVPLYLGSRNQLHECRPHFANTLPKSGGRERGKLQSTRMDNGNLVAARNELISIFVHNPVSAGRAPHIRRHQKRNSHSTPCALIVPW